MAASGQSTGEIPPIEVTVRNIGGIDEARVEFGNGVTVLSGRNATNRTSLLRAITAAMGSDRPSLKSDADVGEVELAIGDETYTRRFERTDGGVVASGDPYLEDAEAAELFAFLLERNEARNAVEEDRNLRNLLLRPLDTDEIEREIRELRAEKSSIDDELETLERQADTLPDLEERRRSIERELEEIRTERQQLDEQIDEKDVDVEESRAEKEELERKLAALSDERNDLERARYELDTERESLENLRSDRDSVESMLDSLEETAQGPPTDLDDRIETLRTSLEDVRWEISELGSVISFNEGMLDEQSPHLFEAGETAPPERLLEENRRITCWSCGTEVETDRIEATIEQLKARREEQIEKRTSLSTEIEELQRERDQRRERRQERDRLERRRERIDRRIDEAEDRIEELQSRVDQHTDRIEELESEITQLEQEERSEELLELHQQANELEFEIGRLEEQRSQITADIDEIESALEERAQLRERRSAITERLTELRTRVERLETGAVGSFNDHLEELIDRLEFENIERVWIERREKGGGRDQSAVMELHVVRQNDNGTAYEDTVETLSESEREVIGLVFALAGYLQYELYEDLPIMVLDSLEAIDADRIRLLVEYFSTYPDSLLVALLPEDAAPLDPHWTITEI